MSVSLFVGAAEIATADISLAVDGVAVTEDFNSFTGTGFSPTPSAGQLDSNTYRVTGLSDGDGSFGGTHDSGDFARGTATGAVSTGGIYSFEVAPGDFAAGVQPTGSDFNSGAVTIRLSNDTGVDLNYLDVQADAFFFNDADRSTRWTFEASLLDFDAFYVPFFSIDSEETADIAPEWQLQSVGGLFELPVSIANGQQVFIRITGEDLAGSGSRDQFALNEFSVTGFNAVPEPGSGMFILAGAVLLGLARRRAC
ncbi:PEP-CTERM sorting domain-containing protein [Mariniblastus fucicola]|nr:PEP-CTERM sorting domain-containing protein [Mariniblastus fucicola]